MAHHIIQRAKFLRRMRGATLPAWMTDNGVTGADVAHWFDPAQPDGTTYAVNDNIPLAGSAIPGKSTVCARQSFISSQPFMRETVGGLRYISPEGDDYMLMQDAGGTINVASDPTELTWFAVVEANGNAGVILMHFDGNTPYIQMQLTGTGNLDVRFRVRDSDSVVEATTLTLTEAQRVVISGRMDKSGGNLRLVTHGAIDGVNTAVGNSTFTGNFSSTERSLFATYTGGGAMNGAVYLETQINRALSDTDQDAAVADLAALYL